VTQPNFFIIGAPKSGTTALASYLSLHPNVFLTDPKEPHHYNSDLNHGSFKDREKYLSLFEQTEVCHSAIGEASVWYLYSSEAVSNILAAIPDAKFIVMLRNPVEMAPSLHEQAVFTGYETERNFEAAWELQKRRRNGDDVPFWCDEPKLLLYEDVCLIGTQYERVARIIPKSNLLPILFDDFKRDTRAVWLDVCKFLGIPDDGRSDFPIVNSAKTRRSLFLRRINDAYCRARLFIGFGGFGSGFFSKVGAWNITQRERPPLDPEFLARLKYSFKEDISLLERSLGRDLSHWL